MTVIVITILLGLSGMKPISEEPKDMDYQDIDIDEIMMEIANEERINEDTANN